ncbi:DEAD-domain-containing protein [Guyanagaster necrorhizus]|uniref:ATP-dependent rRNA helicase RRP3 n=1 Tax=Guyanagaster necrorhizus TaxID=856835 RepID=A0A9P7VS53_9AGAR|nr:DEAD-domain-containing protein [Guyanagaster necrorhizus MCA 3950]KAG7445602.1 DEAD-domain-containing protein [Guyanagaster necrorhizus MCA 3950]
MTETESTATFESLGLSKPLLDAVEKLGYKEPTQIQQQCIPPALEGRDIIGLAPTGSGKTAAFAIPILQKLWDAPQGLFACILSPTHELAHQIATQFEALGAGMGVRCAVIVGGDMDRVAQAVALAKRPHILVATPGRIADHLRNTKGFSLRAIKFLVLDEADRLLDLDFGTHLDDVLKAMPKQRTTYLFSATMTTKVSKLQRASLTNPERIETASSHHTVPTLLQYYVLYPLIHKEALLVYLVNSLLSNSMIVFVRTVHDAKRLSIILRTLNFDAVPLHGDLTRSQRMGALAKFRSGDKKILVATDVASRGLDIPLVDLVINFDVPGHSKDYIHRVGRTARAGRAGKAILIVTQYDVELLQRLECVLEKKLEEWPTDKEDVIAMHSTVDEAGRVAANELRETGKQQKSHKRKRQAGETDDQGIEEVSLLRGSTRARRDKSHH